jgi:hypothetical protein
MIIGSTAHTGSASRGDVPIVVSNPAGRNRMPNRLQLKRRQWTKANGAAAGQLIRLRV